MESVLSPAVRQVVEAAGPPSSAVQREMEAQAEATDFPVVGPAVGGLLRLLTLTVGAERVFEFGSGFGYSASWFASALPADGLVVLTEVDADELAQAREYLAAMGVADRAAFEEGDAFETFARYDGPFDVVLLDCEKSRYPAAIDPIREKLAPGGLLIADNALAASYGPEDIADGLDGSSSSESVAGIVEYVERMQADPAFDTSVVPLGEGLAVSRHTGCR